MSLLLLLRKFTVVLTFPSTPIRLDHFCFVTVCARDAIQAAGMCQQVFSR